MPFRTEVDLNAAARNLMNAAYDSICDQYKIDASDPRSSALAIAITIAVRAGERDPQKLRELALAACSDQKGALHI